MLAGIYRNFVRTVSAKTAAVHHRIVSSPHGRLQFFDFSR